MTEFRVVWQQCPHVQHTVRVLFIEAEDAEQAKAVAKDHIERKFGIQWFSIFEATPYQRPTGGRVLE